MFRQDRLRLKQSNLFIHNSAYIGTTKSERLKWKALSVKAKANKGLFREIEAEELLNKNREDFQAVKKLIQGEKHNQAENNLTEKKRSQALASVASKGGGGSGSTKNANKLKKLLSQSDEQTDDSKLKSPKRESGWAKIKKQIVKNAENFPSPNRDTGPDLVAIVKAAKDGENDEESKARLALLRDARKANRQLKKHIKSTSQFSEEIDMGQRRPDKKSRKLQAQISSSSHYFFYLKIMSTELNFYK